MIIIILALSAKLVQAELNKPRQPENDELECIYLDDSDPIQCLGEE